MIPIFILFTIFSSSYEHSRKKLAYIPSSTNHLLSDFGFYDILIRGGETITGKLDNGNNRLFIIIPSHPDFSIESISIDEQSVTGFSGKRGFAIDGKENTTFKLKSSDSDSVLQVNAWLVPSGLCSNSAMYTYGSRKMKYEKVLSIQDFCTFSPTLDSKNNNFKVKFGINNGISTHDSSLYKFDYTTPQKKVTGSQVANYESGGPFFIQNTIDNSDSYVTIFERKTKIVKFKDKGNKCTMNPFYRCILTGTEVNCKDDDIGKDNSKSCSNSGISKLALALSITFGSLALLGGIAGIIACSCLCSCCACCCCNKKKNSTRKKKIDNQSDDESVNSEKSSKSDKNSDSDEKSDEKTEKNSESKSKSKKDEFDLYKQLKKLYENQDKEIQKMQKQHLQQVESLKKQKQVTKEQSALLDNFNEQNSQNQQQENEQIRQIKDQQLQELLVLQQGLTAVDPLLQ